MKTLVEKVGETRMVKRVLEVMIEKFVKTMGEKTKEMMRKNSGNSFRTEEKIDVMIDKFEEMATEVEKIKLAENLRYALSLQFLERLDNWGKINALGRMRLKDVIEDRNGNPKAEDTLGIMKKKLRKMTVLENREEPFKKESRAYFVRDENNRSRYNDWKRNLTSRGYVRSNSYPNFFRTQSKNNYLRYSSKFGRQSTD